MNLKQALLHVIQGQFDELTKLTQDLKEQVAEAKTRRGLAHPPALVQQELEAAIAFINKENHKWRRVLLWVNQRTNAELEALYRSSASETARKRRRIR